MGISEQGVLVVAPIRGDQGRAHSHGARRGPRNQRHRLGLGLADDSTACEPIPPIRSTSILESYRSSACVSYLNWSIDIKSTFRRLATEAARDMWR